MLMPTEKNAKYQEVLFGEFSKNQLWIRQKCETMKIQECMTLFCEDAERSGYSVTEEAKQKLSGLLETRNEMQLDNETLVLQLIRQIQLDKLMQPETEKQIGEEDIRTVSGLTGKRDAEKRDWISCRNRMRRSRYMLKDGLVYTESRMGYEQEFLEDLTAFDLKSANGTFSGRPCFIPKK